jgi:superfamily II DNA or RNA helicase
MIKKENFPDWSFQEDAIRTVVEDFRKEPYSKNLLVIPTGGGKTIAAIRAINRLIEIGFLTEKDLALWTVHRIVLKTQAEKALRKEENKIKFNFNKKLENILLVKMKEEAKRIILNDSEGIIKLLIIDEAHHSAANGYKDFFARKIGILGLTATPDRTDESILEFDKVSYSITFRELIRRGVILEPEFISCYTQQTVNVSSLDYSRNREQLDSQYNTSKRNEFIADTILKARNVYKKVVIFVGSNNHVDDLYEIIRKRNKFYNEPYHVGYIYSEIRNGKSNEKGIDNERYLEEHQKIEKSIIVNCAMLNEGYDDPLIDTVVMAVPTRSILYYMQCIGRAVRNPSPLNLNKSYVLEFEDNLPNAVYHIDNKWLFADISDFLEPIVLEECCHSLEDFKERIIKIMNQHNVDKKYLDIIINIKENWDTISLLLLKPTSSENYGKWIPLIFEEKNRKEYTRIFNFISDNIDKLFDLYPDYIFFYNLKVSTDDPYFKDRTYRSDFFQALRVVYIEIQQGDSIKRLKYYNFKYVKRDNWFVSFLKFIRDKIRYLLERR